MICPVCKSKNNDNGVFCPVCGWEYRIFPAEISQDVKDLEAKRLEAAKRAFETNSKSVVEMKQELFLVKQSLDDANTKLHKAEDSIASMKEDIIMAEAVAEPYAFLLQSFGGVLQNVYPIYEGDNTFGSEHDDKSGYRQILENSLSPKHFTIRTTLQVNARGRKKASYELIPVGGHTAIGTQGNVIGKTTPLPLLEKIFAGKLVFQLLDNVDN